MTYNLSLPQMKNLECIEDLKLRNETMMLLKEITMKNLLIYLHNDFVHKTKSYQKQIKQK